MGTADAMACSVLVGPSVAGIHCLEAGSAGARSGSTGVGEGGGEGDVAHKGLPEAGSWVGAISLL